MLRKSRKDKVVDQATSTTAQVAHVKDQIIEKVGPAVGHAAGTTREWAGPKVHAAREWAAPRAQKGLDVAAPRVEHAVETVSPKIDAARDKLVDEVLPKLVDAINAATSQAAAARDEAAARGADAVAVIKGDAVAIPKKKKHRLRKVLMLGGLVAGGVAAVKAMRGGPKDDPWATPAGAGSGWATAATEPDHSSTGAVAAEAGLAEAAASEATEAPEAAVGPATTAEAEGATIDLGSGEGQQNAPDGDQPGKVTATRAARKAKPRDDG